VDNVEAAETKP